MRQIQEQPNISLIKTFSSRASSVIRHPWKVKRYLNYRLNTWEMINHKTHVRSFPHILYLDPATMCNLKCPFCPTGNGKSTLKKALLKPDDFNAIVSKLPTQYFKIVHLYNWGESLLNKNLTDYVSYFTDRGLDVWISANFSVKDYDDDYLEALVKCGLTHITLSIDGAKQESYEQYRKGGNFERAIGNARRLNEIKKKLGSQTPHLLYRMLINKFNEHDMEEAEKIAASMGAEFLADENFYIPKGQTDEWIADRVKEKYGGKLSTIYGRNNSREINTECRQLWDTILINADGSVLPCCLPALDNAKIGNLLEQSFQEVWNGEKIKKLRRYTTNRQESDPDFENPCKTCDSRYCTYNN